MGHAMGDRVLQTVARRLRECVRPHDTVARWGGDEFVVLVERLADDEVATALAERIRQSVGRPIEHRGDELLLGASVGVAFARPDETLTADQLLTQADAAMYRSKALGKSRWSVFDAGLRAAADRRTQLEDLLRRAVASGRVVLHYQPIVELESGSIVGAEALLRLLDDDGTLVLPGAFLDFAEESGLILPVEEEVLRQACAAAATWQRAGRALPVSVNICARQLGNIVDLEQLIGRTLEGAGLEQSRLVCEVTEHALVDTGADTRAGMSRMVGNGTDFSVDDFGTGHGSLTYLQVLPVQEIKIDRSFVALAPGARESGAIVRSIATLAHELGVRCVAEGVEGVEQHRFLQSLGVRYAQGYLYGRPVPLSDFDAALP